MDNRPPKRPFPFSIESLLSNNSSSPPKRPFLIEQLLATETNHVQLGSGTSTTPAKPAKEYVRHLGGSVEENRKYKFGKVNGRFSIIALPDDPEALLYGIFDQCINKAVEWYKERTNTEPDHIGCLVSSVLLERPIWTPIRPTNENSVDAILNRFMEVAQSKKQDGITLWGEPFEVIVTTVNRADLPNQRQIIGGSNRRLAPINHRISDQSLIKIQNGDGRCLFYALQATMVHNITHWPRWKFHYYLHSRFGMAGRLDREIDQLMANVNAPPNLAAYDAQQIVPLVIDKWNEQFVGKFKFKCYIFSAIGHYKPIYQYGPDDYNTPILLYYVDGHFHGVQKAGNLFGKRYCLSCESIYDRASRHKLTCKARCTKCSRMGPAFPCKPVQGQFKHCTQCWKDFWSQDCYDWHRNSRFCSQSKQCTTCHVIYDVRDNTRNGRKGHVCNEKWCQKCRDYHDRKRGCYIKPLEPKQEKKPCRYIAFDMETTQHEYVDQQKRKHTPNFIAAKVACADCISSGLWKMTLKGNDSCKVCGNNRTITFSQRPFIGTVVDKEVTTENPLVDFVKWILYELPRQYDTFAYSHYGGKFDNVIVFKELFMQGLNPEMIRKGNKLYEMKVKPRKKNNPMVVFRDSFNLMPMKLAALVPTFGLEVIDKPFFPHMANRPENYGKLIYPIPDDYLASGMMPDKKKEFDKWFAEHGKEPFLLDEALASYCTNDVEILMAGLVAFRREFLDVSKRPAVTADGKADRRFCKTPHAGIDVLRECITIASACMKHFRTNHLDNNKIAIVSDRGYDHGDHQSLLAMRFLKFLACEKRMNPQHAYSREGEKKVGNYKLDGWFEAGPDSYGIEVHGCIWHACPKCYPNDQQEMPIGMLAGVKRELDDMRIKFIRAQIPRLDVFWECEIRRMLQADGDTEFIQECTAKLGFQFDPARMRSIFAQIPEDYGPIDIRSAFMGGRTGPLKVYHKAQPGEKISYYDFTSLYPFINYITPYPVDHPELHVCYEKANWTRPEDNPFELALIKCFVVPPRKLDIPVLPVRVDDRLLFPLCMTCARNYPEGAVKKNYHCLHTDRERGWVTTCTSLELDAALAEGYRVTELYRVLEYKRADDTIFRPYMREFIKQKIEATGFEKGIAGNPELEAKFIKECQEKFGFEIDPTKMVPNKGRRAITKLGANNLWGKFSLKNTGLSESLVLDNPADLGRFLDDKSIIVNSIEELTPETIMIEYEKKKEWVEEHPCSNIVISLFTTSAARLLLLKAMQKVARTPGCKILYTDTDSIIFVHPEGMNPLELGPHLGDFTDEYPEHEIIEFVSGGCKQYALKLRKKGAPPDAECEHTLKIRGITLNHSVQNEQGLKYKTFKEKVLEYARTGQNQPLNIVYPNFLCPSLRTGSVLSVSRKKIYKPFVGKGILDPDTLNVLDFGYRIVKPEPPNDQ